MVLHWLLKWQTDVLTCLSETKQDYTQTTLVLLQELLCSLSAQVYFLSCHKTVLSQGRLSPMTLE